MIKISYPLVSNKLEHNIQRDLHLLRGSICWSLDRILKEKYRTQKNEEKSRTVSPGPLLVQLLVLRVLVLVLRPLLVFVPFWFPTLHRTDPSFGRKWVCLITPRVLLSRKLYPGHCLHLRTPHSLHAWISHLFPSWASKNDFSFAQSDLQEPSFTHSFSASSHLEFGCLLEFWPFVCLGTCCKGHGTSRGEQSPCQ